MHAPIATQRQRSPGATVSAPVAAAAGIKRTAAIQSRAVPTSNGLAAARSPSTVITEPLVPQETAASAIRMRPPTVQGA